MYCSEETVNHIDLRTALLTNFETILQPGLRFCYPGLLKRLLSISYADNDRQIAPQTKQINTLVIIMLVFK